MDFSSKILLPEHTEMSSSQPEVMVSAVDLRQHLPTPVGPDPVRTLCHNCGLEVVTTVKHKSTTKTHLMCLLLCCLLCWPCACCPYCMDTCRNANHYCPNCEEFIGTYQS